MNLQRWLSVSLVMGLILVLSPLSAQAWRNQPHSRQPNHRAFTPQRSRGNVVGWHGQRSQWHRPRGNAFGWHYQRQGHRRRGNAFGWHGQRPRHPFARGHRPGYRQFQHNVRGRYHNPRFPYGRAGYPGNPRSPYFGPRSHRYPQNPVTQVGQTYQRSGFRQSGPSGNSSLPNTQEPASVVESLE